MFSERNILITGCGGFLGSWLAKELVLLGANVIGLDREYKPASMIHEVSSKTTLISGSVEDFQQLIKIVDSYRVEFIFHLAAQSLVGIANCDPLDTFKSNIEGTWNILEIARRLGQTTDVPERFLRGLIVASSDKAYGDQPVLPYVETAPMQGRFPYDVSKSCADLISQSYYQSFRVPVTVTRCGNLYGAGDLNISRIVPDTILQALEGRPVIIRSDGTPIRDYLYIKDAVSAYILLAETMLRDESLYGQAFNLSSQTPMSVLECVKSILQTMGCEELQPIISGTSNREIESQYLDSAKFHKVTGWKPKYTFTAGIAESINWYEKFLKGLGQKGEIDCRLSKQ
jgi:CDP-glucose 4,6-dehydratase